jgi:hypothetical protein
MGFDPRDWPSSARGARPITGNLDALLAENAALKQEVLRLRRLLDRYERLEREPRATAKPLWVSPDQAADWARLLTEQPGWTQLRAGDEFAGLQGLIAQLNRSSFLPQLSLEQRLDRLAPGLGRDLQDAVHRLTSKQRFAVLAAFAVYGVSAREWLADEPLRVVAELRQQCQRLDQTNRARRPGSRTRSDRSSAGERHSGPPPGADPRRAEAYRQLGLAWGASREAIKKAHRRLVKQHHPDVGGEAEAFRRVNDAYQLLMV